MSIARAASICREGGAMIRTLEFHEAGPRIEVMDTHNTVYIVDGDPKVRDAIGASLGHEGLRTEVFASPEEFLSQFKPARKGCVILDLRLAEKSDVDLLASLNTFKFAPPVIATAPNADITTAVRAMQRGAAGFVAKPIDDEKLAEAINYALDVEQQRHPRRKELAELAHRLELLSPEERDVFGRLMAGQKNKIIATDLDLGLRTIEMRRSNIIRKMQAKSVPDLVRMAILLDILK